MASTFLLPEVQAQAASIDAIVGKRLKKLGIPASKPCSDEVFLRRVYLDVIGTLPTAGEARAFLADKGPGKQAKLVSALLGREEFADYWALKWSDLLRVKSEFPINLWPLGAEVYHRWIRTCLKENWPYDRFARALLTASGSNFRAPAVNFYRAVQSKKPEALAKAVALTFMGARAEKWPRKRLDGMAAFFWQVGYKGTAEWKEEIVFNDLTKAARRPAAAFPDGKPAKLAADGDPRHALADWLVSSQNPYFAKNIANRVWSWLMGHGIVHEPDDIRPDNPPSNPELLAYLERSLIEAKWDLKRLFALILNSQSYQASSAPAPANPKAADEFACYRLRRLEAEVLIDAINQVTGATDSYLSMAPEPFTFIPETQRTIALADGSISSPFLEMFGRPSRDTGYEAERNNRPSAGQRLHMLNSSHIQRKIERGPKMQALVRSAKTPGDLVDEMFLTVLSRFPAPQEKQTALDYLRTAGQQAGAMDVAWALLNSSEFAFRH